MSENYDPVEEAFLLQTAKRNMQYDNNTRPQDPKAVSQKEKTFQRIREMQEKKQEFGGGQTPPPNSPLPFTIPNNVDPNLAPVDTSQIEAETRKLMKGLGEDPSTQEIYKHQLPTPNIYQPNEDPRQMLFDFEKHIKAEDIYGLLETINTRLERVENNIKSIIEWIESEDNE